MIKKFEKDNRSRKSFAERALRSTRFLAYLDKTHKKQQIFLLKSYCQLTAAGKSVYYQFALSRHSLRKNANFGLVSGVKPSSW